MKTQQVTDLVYQALETEMGGVKIYRSAIRSARNRELKKEWSEYLEQTRMHEQVVRTLCKQLGLDPDVETPSRKIVRHKGEALLKAMEMARRGGNGDVAQLVAAECVVDAETKDHGNWELLGEVGKHMKGPRGSAIREAVEEVEDEEDEHLYHTTGWCRELAMKGLGLPAQLPPPEEKKDVKTAIGASRAKQQRRPR